MASGKAWKLRPLSGYLISGSVPLILIGLVIGLGRSYSWPLGLGLLLLGFVFAAFGLQGLRRRPDASR